jgi:hypothetical protein
MASERFMRQHYGASGFVPKGEPMHDPLFQVHRLNEDGLKKADEIAGAFNNCLVALKTMCPEGREFSIVKTKLEEAAFFAKKSMANVAANQS